MRKMALDVGDKTIGIAVTDAMNWSVQPVDTIKRKRPELDIKKLKEYIGQYSVKELIVGIPLRGDGEIGTQARKILRFVERLKKELSSEFKDLIVKTWDESMTTSEAHEIFKEAGISSGRRKEIVDKIAAAMILQSYLRYQEEEGES